MNKLTKLASNKYLYLLISLVITLWIIYLFVDTDTDTDTEKKEPFTSRIRPHIRTVNKLYEGFIDNYGVNVIMTKLRKWNIL